MHPAHFFMTTLVFGKTEVIGHTLIHAALIVFLLEGPGRGFRPPIALHRAPALRAAFAAVNLVLLLAVMLPVYAWGARAMHENAANSEPRLPGTHLVLPGQPEVSSSDVGGSGSFNLRRGDVTFSADPHRRFDDSISQPVFLPYSSTVPRTGGRRSA